MQIPVKFYKLLNVPAEPAEPNSFYLIIDDDDNVAEIYVTDTDGDLHLVGNSAFVSAIVDAALDLKADLASPEFTGTPIAPTADPDTATEQIATTEFVTAAVVAAITNLIGAAPGALDTLQELAAALGDDEDFAATFTASLATAFDRANHTGTQSADTITDGTTNKAFLATERTKLAGIATGATANDTDANLKTRANHTGTQSADTITDGSTNKAYTATEKTKLSGIATGATANSSDATLKARANHTGTQSASTISDLDSAAIVRLATTVVNTNVGTQQTIYTVPAGKTAIITMVVLRNPTANLSSYLDGFGLGFLSGMEWAGGDAFYVTQYLQNSNDVVVCDVANQVGDGTPRSIRAGAVGDPFKLQFFNTGTAGAVTVDVFGYYV